VKFRSHRESAGAVSRAAAGCLAWHVDIDRRGEIGHQLWNYFPELKMMTAKLRIVSEKLPGSPIGAS